MVCRAAASSSGVLPEDSSCDDVGAVEVVDDSSVERVVLGSDVSATDELVEVVDSEELVPSVVDVTTADVLVDEFVALDDVVEETAIDDEVVDPSSVGSRSAGTRYPAPDACSKLAMSCVCAINGGGFNLAAAAVRAASFSSTDSKQVTEFKVRRCASSLAPHDDVARAVAITTKEAHRRTTECDDTLIFPHFAH